MSAAVPMATTSAPRAIALAMSADERMEPAAMIEARLRMPSSRSRWSTTAMAISSGMPTWSRTTCGAAVEIKVGQGAKPGIGGHLPDLDLHGGAAVEVLRVHAEAPRGHLHDHVVLVREQVGVQAALAGVHEDAAALGGPRQGAVHVERHRSVAHRREDDGRLELHVVAQAGAALEAEAATAVRLDLHRVRLAAQVRAQLHGLAQGVDGRVGDLARVQHEMIEHAEVRLVVAHAGEHHRAGLGLPPYGLAQAR